MHISRLFFYFNGGKYSRFYVIKSINFLINRAKVFLLYVLFA